MERMEWHQVNSGNGPNGRIILTPRMIETIEPTANIDLTNSMCYSAT